MASATAHVVRGAPTQLGARLDSPRPGESLPLPPAAVAGPFFDQAGILLDHLFICVREVSWAAYEARLVPAALGSRRAPCSIRPPRAPA